MSKPTRIIKIANNKLYYTNSEYINIHETNFPASAGFNERFETFWLIEILEYKKEENILNVTVIDYNPEEISAFYEQKSKSKIKSLHFFNLKWEKLEPILFCYQKSELSDIVDNIFEDLVDYNDEFESPEIEKKAEEQLSFFEQDNLQEIKLDSKVNKHITTFNYYFKDANFKLGFVSIEKFFNFYFDKIELKIYNSEILPEYDFIKNYFQKVLKGKKQFKVKAIIEIQGNKIIKTRAYSNEINSINDELISSIKKLRTLEIVKLVQNQDIDKSLFVADEIWDTATDEGQDGNIFKQSEEDIINMLMNLKDVRNRKQLEYIAGSKHNPKEKIRFTLRPLFGFIFFIEGETMNHFCWELLNSHATYMWSFEKDERTDVQIKRLEEIINIIRDTGRKKYKSAYLRNELDTDIFFNTINHKYAKSDFKDSFVMWKHKFKEMIV